MIDRSSRSAGSKVAVVCSVLKCASDEKYVGIGGVEKKRSDATEMIISLMTQGTNSTKARPARMARMRPLLLKPSHMPAQASAKASATRSTVLGQ